MSPYREPAVTVPDKPVERYWRPQVWAMVFLTLVALSLVIASLVTGQAWYYFLFNVSYYCLVGFTILLSIAIFIGTIWLIICKIISEIINCSVIDLVYFQKVKFGIKKRDECEDHTDDPGPW
jgi:hypothetical protein